MKATFWSGFAGVVLLAGCASPPTTDVYTYRSGLAGPDMDITLDNLLESREDQSFLVWLNAVRVRDGAWEARYYLEVRYEGASDAGYIDIGPGQSLLLTIDGKAAGFHGLGSEETRERTANGHFVENVIYPATPDDLRKIARAREVKVQVVGRQRSLYREFQAANLEKFRAFVLTHMGF
jgi:hypothetical protein